MENWTKIETYRNAPSYIDFDHARNLLHGCRLSHQTAYEYLLFLDMSGVEDPGDYVSSAPTKGVISSYDERANAKPE